MRLYYIFSAQTAARLGSLVVITLASKSGGSGFDPHLYHILVRHIFFRHQFSKYYQIRAQQVRISRKRHFTCLCRPILCSAAILGEKRAQTYARILIKPEVTGRFCWFLIANTGWPNSRSCSILKWIGQKLRPWECRIRNELKALMNDLLNIKPH